MLAKLKCDWMRLLSVDSSGTLIGYVKIKEAITTISRLNRIIKVNISFCSYIFLVVFRR